MSWIRNASLVLASTAIAVVLAEMILMVLPGKAKGTADTHIARQITNLPLHDFARHFCSGPLSRNMPEQISGWREWPNSSYFELRNDQANFFEHNDLGFRGSYEILNGRSGVVVLGDSYTRGDLADETETMPSFLSRWSTSHQFFNFGTSGHGTLQHAATYSEIKSRVEHDAVIVIFYIPNDLQDNVKFDDWLEAGRPNPKEDEENSPIEDEESSFVELRRTTRIILEKFEVGRLVLTAYRTTRAPGMADWSSVPTDREIQLLDESMDALTRQLDDKQLFIITIPGRPEFESNRNWEREDPVGYSLLVRSALDQLSEKYELQVLHLSDGLRKAVSNDGVDQLYDWPNYHLKENGYYIASKLIARWLSSRLEGYSPVIEETFVNQTEYLPSNLACPQ